MLQCQQHHFRLEKTWRISLSSQTLVAIGINGYFFQANMNRISAKFRQILMSSLHPLPMKIKKNKSSYIAVHAMCQRRRKQKKFLQTTSGNIYQLESALFFFISLLAAYLLMIRMLTYTEKA